MRERGKENIICEWWREQDGRCNKTHLNHTTYANNRWNTSTTNTHSHAKKTYFISRLERVMRNTMIKTTYTELGKPPRIDAGVMRSFGGGSLSDVSEISGRSLFSSLASFTLP
jgi:hypothetical protein